MRNSPETQKVCMPVQKGKAERLYSVQEECIHICITFLNNEAKSPGAVQSFQHFHAHSKRMQGEGVRAWVTL